MKLFKLMKDGGKESRVWGFFLAEIKSLFSVVLLRFADGSREAYHSHAFNSISWVLKGKLTENRRFDHSSSLTEWKMTEFRPSLKPIITTRDNMHKVVSTGNTYVLSFRGPWTNTWKEFLPGPQTVVTLTHGRKELSVSNQVHLLNTGAVGIDYVREMNGLAPLKEGQ